jgi:lipoprotein NlpD
MFMLRAMRTKNIDGPLTAAQRAACAAALMMLAACATRLDPAPVVDRSGAMGMPPPAPTQPAAESVPLGPPPPGYYRVKPGDTLYRIALENGQNYRDIAAWNNLANPNQIESNQLLRVAPPDQNATAATPGIAAAPIVGGPVQTAPLANGAAPVAGAPGAPVAATQMPPFYGGGSTATTIPPQPPSPATVTGPGPVMNGGHIAMAWPAHGPILNPFDDTKNKGINIGGSPGEAVRAAADGRVVYAGNGLRGYGNLIIIKHNAMYLTAYAHNRALMVKEGDSVTRGEKIAEMGNSDADRVMLHFEVRQQGKPVDPMKYLPPQ